jgi:hypothetical protein
MRHLINFALSSMAVQAESIILNTLPHSNDHYRLAEAFGFENNTFIGRAEIRRDFSNKQYKE